MMLAIAPKGEEDDEGAEESDELAAASDFAAAVKDGDPESILLAFRAMMKVC